MKEIKAINKSLKELRAERERLHGTETKRCEDTLSAKEQHVAKDAELRQRYSQELALAAIENRDPNTEPLTAELAAVEQSGAQLRIASDAAREGLRIIGERLTAIDADIEQLVAKRRGLIRTDLESRREIAIDEYVEAVEALAPIFAKMVSADRLLRKICAPEVVRQLPGEGLLERLRLERLPIPWERSGKERPVPRGARGWAPGTFAAAEPFVKYEPVLAAPAWLHDDSLIDASMESLAGELRAAGVDGI